MAGGMPLAFTQEDFLVFRVFYKVILAQNICILEILFTSVELWIIY